MERQILMVILSAAATAMVVAAALGWFSGRSAGARGWLAGVVALLAGVAAGSRFALEKWAVSPGQSAEWMPHVAIAAGVVLIASAFMPARWWWARAAAAGLAGAAVVCGPALGRLLGRVEPAGEKWAWWCGIAIGSAALAWMVAGAYRRVEREDEGAGGVKRIGARLRDDHWPTVAVGLVLGLGAMAILFAGTSMKLMQLGLALAGAWGGLAGAALVVRPRIGMGGAGAAAAAMYAGLWLTAYFTHDPPRGLAMGLGLGAVGMLVIGTTGPVARRGGWVRLAVVASGAAGLVVGACALHGPAYLDEIRKMEELGYGP